MKLFWNVILFAALQLGAAEVRWADGTVAEAPPGKLLSDNLGYYGDVAWTGMTYSYQTPPRAGSGDADVWPLGEQTKLFGQLLEGRVTESIDVKLTDSLLMLPYKSSSGVLFAAEHDFETCRLCHRKNCPNRRAAFDEELWLRNQSTDPNESDRNREK